MTGVYVDTSARPATLSQTVAPAAAARTRPPPHTRHPRSSAGYSVAAYGV